MYMWTSTTFQSPIICEQSRRKPLFTQNGGFLSRGPWSRIPGSTHSSATHKNGFLLKGERACVSKVHWGHPFWSLPPPLGSNESHQPLGFLSATVRNPESSTDGFLSGYGSCLQGNHWSVIKKEQRKIVTKSLEAREDSVSQIVKS